MATTTRLLLPYIAQSQAQPEVAYNESMFILDTLVQPIVISLGALTAPPGSPSTGDSYVPGSGATGAWAGLDDYIVTWDGSEWDAIAPFEGAMVYNLASDSHWVYHTEISPDAWVEFTGGSTDEQMQDAVGAILLDTATVNLTYDDGVPSIEADVITQMSVTSDASGLKLDGDATSPGNSYFYGTNGSGTRGWYAQSGIAAYNDEMAQDAIGGILENTATVAFTYSDGSPTSIYADVIGVLDTEQLIPAGSPLAVTPSVSYLPRLCFITSVSGALTINDPTGSPSNFHRLFIRIKSAAAQTLTFGSAYRGSNDLSLPTATTGSGLTDYLMFAYNTADSKWDYLAKTFGF